MNEWKALSGRVTLLFHGVTSAPPSAQEVFRAAWDKEPDSYQKPPNPIAPSIAQGRRGEMVAMCSTATSRIDFQFGPSQSQIVSRDPASFPLINDASQLYDSLESLCTCIENLRLPPIERVAVGLQLVQLTPGITESNKLLVKVIPSEYGIQLTNEEDFILQINKPFQYPASEPVRMNFTVKWSVERMRVMTFTVPAPRHHRY
jgi:hypothetical protein